MDLQQIRAVTDALRTEVRKAVVGQDEVFDFLLTSLLIGGHILLEGVPGTAKTLLTQAFAAGLSLQFGRIQFTPDLMPGDVLGTNLFNFQTNAFVLTKGPIFTQLLLADEINRTPPKTQAALLQAMNERAVTIDGRDYPLGEEFMVVATQNPIEQQGTYPLPEAQLDRFLFKILIAYPARDEEREIVRRHGHRSAMPRLEEFGLGPVVAAHALAEMREAVTRIRLSEALVDYIVDVVRASREHASLEVGASTRAANMLAAAVRGYAALQGRDFVIPDDIKLLALPVMRHRVTLSPGAEIEGLSSDRILREILDQVPAPR
jgi:MoxR-like ATPase